jgi:predicted nucleic acid-binding protein
MIIVADTAPIHYLILIDEIEVLRTLAGGVIVPQAVFQELQAAGAPEQVREWIGSQPDWFEVRQADTSLFTPRKKIGAGETEAIALAIKLKADALLIDDSDAIKEAHQLQIPTLRLFNILEDAAKKNLLDLPQAVEKIKRTNFHLPPAELIEAMLERDRQIKQAS